MILFPSCPFFSGCCCCCCLRTEGVELEVTGDVGVTEASDGVATCEGERGKEGGRVS